MRIGDQQYPPHMICMEGPINVKNDTDPDETEWFWDIHTLFCSAQNEMVQFVNFFRFLMEDIFGGARKK